MSGQLPKLETFTISFPSLGRVQRRRQIWGENLGATETSQRVLWRPHPHSSWKLPRPSSSHRMAQELVFALRNGKPRVIEAVKRL